MHSPFIYVICLCNLSQKSKEAKKKLHRQRRRWVRGWYGPHTITTSCNITQFIAFICDVRSTKWRLTDFRPIVLIALPQVATKERTKFHSQALVDGESKQLKDWTQRINSKTTLFFELWKEKLLSISVTTSHGNGQICQNFPRNPQVRREVLVALYLDWLQRPLEVVLLLQGKKVWRCQFGLSVLLQARLVQRFVITHGQRDRLQWTMLRRKGSRIY